VLGNGRGAEEEAGEEHGDVEVAIEEELKTPSLKGKSNTHHWTGSYFPPPPLGMQQQDTPFQTRVNYAQLSIFDLNFTESAH